MSIHEGQVVEGLFRITKVGFAKGAMGEIHLAVDSNGHSVALKFIRADNSMGNLEPFKKEYENLLKFSHPNVAKALHLGEHEGRFYFASEFVEGREFRLAAAGQMPENLVPLFIQALEGLQAIHNLQMLHLDLKSSNLLVTSDGTVKIIDFGFATALGRLPAGSLHGTIPYMAPELVLGREIDTRADLFSMGVLMYYAVGGKYPFIFRNSTGGDFEKLKAVVEREKAPPRPSSLNIYVPEYLNKIILGLLPKAPEDRFGTARAVINALKTHHPEDYREAPEARGSYLVPEGNVHIGRTQQKKQIFENLDRLLNGVQPQQAVFLVEGEEGMGKSHLLRKIKEHAEKWVEKISIHSLEFPKKGEEAVADNDWVGEWTALLKQRLAENKKPVLVLVDNVVDLPPVLKNVVQKIKEWDRKSSLYQSQQPIMVCLAGGQGTLGDEAAVRIQLEAFSKKEIEGYLAATPALCHKKIPQDWVEALYNQTGGNPREIQEQLRLQDSKGLLFDLSGEIHVVRLEDASLEMSVSAGGENMAETTRERLSQSLGKLTTTEREILEWMAVWQHRNLQPSISIEDSRNLMVAPNLLVGLNSLTSRGLIEHRPKTDAYAFQKFSYLPALIYKNMEPDLRHRLHQKICDHIKKKGKPFLFHQALGTKPKEALRAIVQLVRHHLYEKGQAHFVKELLERGLEIAEHQKNFKLCVFFLTLLSKTCGLAAEYESSSKFYNEARECLRRMSHAPRVLAAELAIAMLPTFLEMRKFEEAEKLIEETLRVCSNSTSSHIIPVLHNFRARIFYKRYFSQKENGPALLKKSCEIFRHSETLEARLHPHQKNLVRNNDLGIVLQALGDNDGAVKALEAKMARLCRNPNIFIEMNTLFYLAESHRFLKNFEKAFEYARKALTLAQETNQGKWIVYAHHILAGIHQHSAIVLAENGKKEEARRQFSRALKENTSCLAASVCLENRKESEMYALGTFLRSAQCTQELAQWDRASEYYRAALNYSPPEIYLGQIYLGLGECCLHKGEAVKAGEYLNQAEALVKKMPPHIAEPSARLIRKALARLQKQNKGREHVEGR